MIKLNDVSYSYKNNNSRQLTDISMEIKKGEFVLLCGQSGSGKTTVTKLINGLIPHFIEGDLLGNIEINNEDTKKLNIYEISAQVGSIFQNPKTQFFNLDSDSELIFGLENIGASKELIEERVKKAVAELRIEHLKNRNVFNMSGGEKQLLAIASVYATNPEIYVFDEPSSNIDELGINALREVLIKLKNQGKTIIISEHRLYYFIDLVDKAIYLEEGKITNIFRKDEMQHISDEDRKILGLRTLKKAKINSKIKKLGYDCQDDLLIENISYKIHGKEILKNISLSANIGDVVAITGPNGAGKSTLMRLLCGLIKETKGCIRYKGKFYKAKERNKLCYMVMQDVIHQFFAESLEEEFTVTNPELTEREIDRYLEKMGLIKFKDSYPLSLSGGQMQRLAVAVAMLMDKEIMIFDEPTSGLDYSNMLRISELIKTSSKDKIIFIISHDKELINECCSKIIRIEKGYAIEGRCEECLY